MSSNSHTATANDILVVRQTFYSPILYSSHCTPDVNLMTQKTSFNAVIKKGQTKPIGTGRLAWKELLWKICARSIEMLKNAGDTRWARLICGSQTTVNVSGWWHLSPGQLTFLVGWADKFIVYAKMFCWNRMSNWAFCFVACPIGSWVQNVQITLFMGHLEMLESCILSPLLWFQKWKNCWWAHSSVHLLMSV